MKIIVYSLTPLGKVALNKEFVEFANMTPESKKEFDKIFEAILDKDKGMVALKGSPLTDYVQPWAVKAKIVEALALEGAKEKIDFRVVLE